MCPEPFAFVITACMTSDLMSFDLSRSLLHLITTQKTYTKNAFQIIESENRAQKPSEICRLNKKPSEVFLRSQCETRQESPRNAEFRCGSSQRLKSHLGSYCIGRSGRLVRSSVTLQRMTKADQLSVRLSQPYICISFRLAC